VRTALINTGTLAMLAVLMLLAFEGWLRLTVPASSSESIYEYTLETKRYKRMKAGASVSAWGKELKTNNLGFRDDADAIPAKRPGEFRIVVLGDSFTVSAGVHFADIYTSRLQKHLREHFPDVRVINLAVGGYNIVQYALVLQEVALGLQPDMLLVALFPDNDFSMDTYDTNYRVASGQEPAQPQLAWHKRLYVYRAYLGRVETRVRQLFAAGRAQGESDSRAGWVANVAALQTIADIARRERLPLAVALLPHTWHLERQRGLFARVHGVCREQGLSCLDLLEPLIARKVDAASLRLNAIDAHPNEKYNALVAEELSQHFFGLLNSLNGPLAFDGTSASAR
jgi:hypothetical protein